MNPQEWLNTIAQRLDELADEGPPELLDLAEDLGRIADMWPTDPPPSREGDPRWLQEIREVLERAAAEILHDRYGGSTSQGPTLTVSIPNPNYDRWTRQAMMAVLPPGDLKARFKGSIA